MPRVLSLTKAPADWKPLLQDPEVQWKPGHTARALAHCWEAANGFPPEVAKALATSTDPLLRNLVPVLAVPEFRVPLALGHRPARNDLFVLAKSRAGPVTIMVEGKVRSSGPTPDERRGDAALGEQGREGLVLEMVGLDPRGHLGAHYQLFHRAASALIAGEQFRAVAAIVLVHAFDQANTGWTDYQSFSRLFGVEPVPGYLQRLGRRTTLPLYGVWVAGDRSFLDS